MNKQTRGRPKKNRVKSSVSFEEVVYCALQAEKVETGVDISDIVNRELTEHYKKKGYFK